MIPSQPCAPLLSRKTRDPVILLVEDDPAYQELTRRALAGRASVGRELRLVTDGDQAIDYLDRSERPSDPAATPRPDLVLLDLGLPGASGLEVLRHIRSQPGLANLPVVVLSGSDSGDDIDCCYRERANSYVSKPANAHSFFEAVQRIFDYWMRTVTLPQGAA